MAKTETTTQEPTNEAKPGPLVILTEAAQVKARKFLAEEEDPSGKVLRVGVNTGGCSGFSYLVSVDLKKDDDIVQSYGDFEVVIDPISKQFLKGMTLDYVDDIGHAGFKFDNPQASSSCGCGISFDI